MLSVSSGTPHAYNQVVTSSGDTVTSTVEERSVTHVTTTTDPNLDWGAVLRSAGIGGAVGGVVAGVSLLAKWSLPLIGRVGGLAGVARLTGFGAGIGLTTAVLPVIWPKLDRHPTLKAAVTGAGIGAAASAVVPFVGPVFGALAGAAIGAGVHWAHNRHVDLEIGRRRWDEPSYIPMPPMVPPPNFGYGNGPAIGMPTGFGVPTGWGSPPAVGYGWGSPTSGYLRPGLLSRLLGTAGSWGSPTAQAYGAAYGPSPYGASSYGANPYPYGAYGQLPLGAAGQSPRAVSGQSALPVAAPPASSRSKTRAKSKAGRGKAAKGRHAGGVKRHVAAPRAIAAPPLAGQPAGIGLGVPANTYGSQGYGMAGLATPAAYVNPALAGVMPFVGGSPFAAGAQFAGRALPGIAGAANLGMSGPGLAGAANLGMIGPGMAGSSAAVPALTGLGVGAITAPGAMPVAATAPGLSALPPGVL